MSVDSKRGFSTFTGVFIPNVTMMLGIILFLRLGVVLGNVGIGKFVGIIAISLLVMMITSRSIASIVTNMEVGSGGAYFLISRSLGIEIGGACGIALVLSQLISFSLCVTGFAYSFQELMPEVSIIHIELVTMICLVLLSSISAKWALQTQTVVFYILIISILSIVYSSSQSALPNISYNVPKGFGFWEGFALFYPALTGIEAGMALSGNLKNPSRSLAIGNPLSLLFVGCIYTFVALVLWASYSPEVLQSTPLLLITDSKFPSLIYIGLWCAALSSALGNLLGAPRMLQAIAEDGIVPDIFRREYGRYREPLYAIAAIFTVAFVMTLFTTIDQILPILAMICLLTYGTLNFVASFAELIHIPNWRPRIRCPWQLSFAGAVACFCFMLMIDVAWTFASITIVFGIYLYLRRRSLEVSFADFRNNIILFFSRIALYRLSSAEEHPVNWIPQILVLSRAPMQHEKMIEIAHAMTRRNGILSIASVVPGFWDEPDQIEGMKQCVRDWLQERGIECLLEMQSYSNFYEGVENLTKLYGIGQLQPNTLLLSASDIFDQEEYDGLIKVIETAQQNSKNLILFFNGKNVSKKIKDIDFWWDPNSRESFELMLCYILALRMSKYFDPKLINLRAVASDKSAKKHLNKHFQELFITQRMRVKTKIGLGASDYPYMHFSKISGNTGLIFYPLRSIASFEHHEEYRAYLEDFSQHIPDNIPVLAITCYDQLDHKDAIS